jgi:protease IV
MRLRSWQPVLPLLFATSAMAAEPFSPRAERLPTPGKNAASEDSADSIVLNPANLANQTSWELRYTGVRCTDTKKVGCGHSFEAATTLPFGFGTGLRADYVLPAAGSLGPGFPYDGRELLWLTWGLGYRYSERLMFGASVQWAYSTSPYMNGLIGISAGLSYRPQPYVAFAAGVHDLNGPAGQLLPPRGLPLLDRTYFGALALRPTGKRELEAGIELRYFDGSEDARPRATIGVDIPGVGRARGDIEVSRIGDDARRAYVATAGLELSLGRLTFGGGLLLGSGLGQSDSLGQYGTIGYSGFETSARIPSRDRAVFIRLEQTPGNRAHVHLVRSLLKLSEAKDIALVNLVLRAEPAVSFAHAEELADALRVLRARGKKTLCSLEDAGATALYVCANADRTAMNPAGGLRYSGLKSTHMYLAGMLRKLGIKAEFVRIGAHKSAPEQFMNEGGSDVARGDQADQLAQREAVFVRNLALYRHLDEAHIRATTRKGPFIASEALEARFIDETAFDDQLEAVAGNLLGRRIPYEKYEPELTLPKSFGPRPKVALLYVEGDMVDGRSSRVPLLGMQLAGSYTIAETVKQLADDPDVRSVVLRIESPGGSSLAADVMWRELRLLAKKKPLVVSMGSIAASGGYYIATAGHPIYALPLTLTGSIGIFYGKADMSGLLQKIGVNVEVNKTTPRADAESLFRGFSEEEREELNRKVGQFYDVFLSRVAVGRGMSKAAVDKVGQGHVWMGQQAKDRNLVDAMGGIRQALETARELGRLPSDAPVVEYPEHNPTLLDRALDLAGIHASASFATLPATLPEAVRGPLQAVAPAFLYATDTALARLDWVSEDDLVATEAP